MTISGENLPSHTYLQSEIIRTRSMINLNAANINVNRQNINNIKNNDISINDLSKIISDEQVLLQDLSSIIDIDKAMLADLSDIVAIDRAALVDLSSLRALDRDFVNDLSSIIDIDKAMLADLSDIVAIDRAALVDLSSLRALDRDFVNDFVNDLSSIIDIDKAMLADLSDIVAIDRAALVDLSSLRALDRDFVNDLSSIIDIDKAMLVDLSNLIAFDRVSVNDLSKNIEWNQLGEDIDIEEEANYDIIGGYSVALSNDGKTVAFGAINNFLDGSGSGNVKVYEFSNGSWNQLGDDLDGVAAGDQSGRSVALSSDGNIIAIGAHGNDGNGPESGHVRVYEFSNNSWNQLGDDIEGEAAGDYSGWSVALSSDGNRLAIGAVLNDNNIILDSGHVRVYEFSNGSWNQLGDDLDGEAESDNTGVSVALSSDGNRLAIGAISNNTGSGSGNVKVYEFSNGSWNQLGDDLDGVAAGDQSGWSIALSSDGNIVAIGGRFAEGSGNNSGHVRVYEFSNGSWNQLGDDVDGEAPDDQFGQSVALSSDGARLAVGALRNDVNGPESGHVRVYEFSNNSWNQLGDDIDGEAAGDYSGVSVALSSNGTFVAFGGMNGVKVYTIYNYETNCNIQCDKLLIKGSQVAIQSVVDASFANYTTTTDLDASFELYTTTSKLQSGSIDLSLNNLDVSGTLSVNNLDVSGTLKVDGSQVAIQSLVDDSIRELLNFMSSLETRVQTLEG